MIFFFFCILHFVQNKTGNKQNCKTLPFRSIQSMDLERKKNSKGQEIARKELIY